MKAVTTVTIDAEVLEKARALGINLSGGMNDYLKSMIAISEKDISGLNLEIEIKKRNKLAKQLGDIQAQFKACNDHIQAFQELTQKKDQERLEKEKETMERQKECYSCKTTAAPKWHAFGNIKVCSGCFMGSNAQRIKEWMEAGKK
jgi:post-segregation antitoxin (ccd killing protein)